MVSVFVLMDFSWTQNYSSVPRVILLVPHVKTLRLAWLVLKTEDLMKTLCVEIVGAANSLRTIHAKVAVPTALIVTISKLAMNVMRTQNSKLTTASAYAQQVSIWILKLWAAWNVMHHALPVKMVKRAWLALKVKALMTTHYAKSAQATSSMKITNVNLAVSTVLIVTT